MLGDCPLLAGTWALSQGLAFSSPRVPDAVGPLTATLKPGVPSVGVPRTPEVRGWAAARPEEGRRETGSSCGADSPPGSRPDLGSRTPPPRGLCAAGGRPGGPWGHPASPTRGFGDVTSETSHVPPDAPASCEPIGGSGRDDPHRRGLVPANRLLADGAGRRAGGHAVTHTDAAAVGTWGRGRRCIRGDVPPLAPAQTAHRAAPRAVRCHGSPLLRGGVAG